MPEGDEGLISRAGEIAGAKAGDPDRLLFGEDPETSSLDDAKHWVAVYEELMDFKANVVGVTEGKLAQMEQRAARREVVETDGPLLEAERQRLHKRLSFWRARVVELERGS